jgi:hypothetical protein
MYDVYHKHARLIIVITMKSRDRQQRKSYGMRRMGKAIGRAIQCASGDEQARAIRWAGAWGLLCGIRSPGVRLRDAGLVGAE